MIRELLEATLTFRESPSSETPVEDRFDSSLDAIARFKAVLLHEAADAMREPVASPSTFPYQPVDVDTGEPGATPKVVHTPLVEATTPLGEREKAAEREVVERPLQAGQVSDLGLHRREMGHALLLVWLQGSCRSRHTPRATSLPV